MSSGIAELEKFVESLDIPLSRKWFKKCCVIDVTKGEKEMSFEETAAAVTYPEKMNETTRGYVAQHEIPFSVTRVSDPWDAEYPDGPSKMKHVRTVFIDVEFSNKDVAQHEAQITSRMTIAFALGYDGRDAIIESLREDVAQKGVVENVALLQAGRFFSMKPARKVGKNG